jgi:hypothetical protein
LIVTPYEDVGISDMLTVYELDSKFDSDGLKPTDITRWSMPGLIGAPESPSGIPKEPNAHVCRCIYPYAIIPGRRARSETTW